MKIRVRLHTWNWRIFAAIGIAPLTACGGSTFDDDGSGGGGSGGGFNLNWDAAWEVRTKVGDFGWSAEFSIPFRTLRYRMQRLGITDENRS